MTKTSNNEKLHVKTGDTVIVISGKDKGKIGTVKEAMPQDDKVTVEGINMVTKATRANPMRGVQGGLVQMEAPIFSSKVMLYCQKCEKPTRIKHEVLENGAKTRVCMHCNEQLDV